MNKILIGKARIKKKVSLLAKKISRDYRGKELILIGILKGSFVFLSDLIRELRIPVTVDFMQISSYGKRKLSSGTVKIKKNINANIKGKHVLLVEDIVDCGYTLNYALKSLKRKNPTSLAICTLLDKPSRRKIDVSIAYKGFEIPDKFVVGYGLDYNEKFRNFPEVRSIDP